MRFRQPAALGRLAPFGPTILRVMAGIVFLVHGLDKLNNGVEGVGGFFGSLNIPMPQIMAWVITILEIGGGILLIVGLGTRLVATLFAIEMVFTILLVKADAGVIGQQGAGAEIDMMLLAAGVALALLGPGALSVDGMVGLEPKDGLART